MTQCSGEGCPKCNRCYRHIIYLEYAIGARRVFVEPPYKDGNCNYFKEN